MTPHGTTDQKLFAEIGVTERRSPVVRATLSLFLLIMVASAEPEPSMANTLREMDAAWRTIEPQLFAADARKFVGEWVRCGGAPISLRPPLTIKLMSGIIVRITKLQGADRDALATFRKPPSVVTVWGPIVSVDAPTRTVTVKAVSTMFEQ
jgi:hypothetical protein